MQSFNFNQGRVLSPPTGGRGRRAFTLIEVMVAAAVLAVALSSAIIVIQSGFRNLDIARTSTAASQIIQSEMERLRLLNWAAISALPASAQVDIPSSHSSSVVAGGRVSIVRTVSTVSGRNGEMKAITLTATWTGTSGHTHTRIFKMRYAKNGLFDYYYNSAQS